MGLVSKLDDGEAVKAAVDLYRALVKRGYTVVPEAQLAQLRRLGGGRELQRLEADLIITVGGDGTVLKTCMSVPRPETPILAVNMGRRGYLTEVEPKDALKAVENFARGKCSLEERSKLSVSYGGRWLVDGLNEAVITSSIPSKMIGLSVELDTAQSIDFRADGLIVSTPTGSTAYALSAGGPILDSSLEAFVLAFICPLERLTPLVVSMKRTIRVELTDQKLKGLIVVDGRFQRELTPAVPIEIKMSEHKAVFARLGPAPKLRTLMHLEPRGRMRGNRPRP